MASQEKFSIFSYVEKVQYGIFFASVGCFLIFSAIITLLINEGYAIYEFKMAAQASDDTYIFINNYKIWLFRMLGLILLFIGIKSFSSIFDSIFTIVPSLKKKLFIMRYRVAIFISIITTLTIIALVWIFVKPLLSLALLVLALLTYKAKKKVTKKMKLILEEELVKEEKSNSNINDMIDSTYNEISEKTKNKKDIITFLIKKL